MDRVEGVQKILGCMWAGAGVQEILFCGGTSARTPGDCVQKCPISVCLTPSRVARNGRSLGAYFATALRLLEMGYVSEKKTSPQVPGGGAE